jgi:malonyl-CoA/methylmalonyl-CoA synthetase
MMTDMPNHFLQSLRASFARSPHRTALIYQERTYSYADLEARALDWAQRLQALGLEPGDRVALCTEDKLAFLEAHLGTLWAGGVSLPLNPRYTLSELEYFFADSGARLAVAGAATRDAFQTLQARLPELRAVVEPTSVRPAAGRFREPACQAADAALMIYSSGTTGWPKGVVHTHQSLASGLGALASCWRVSSDDRVVNVLPLFHVHGLCFATHLLLLAGGSVLMGDFEPAQTLALVGRGTIFMAVPTIYYRLLEQPDFRSAARGWKDVRLFTCGSAPVRPEILPELEMILGRPLINRYGMSEAMVITSLPLDGPWPHGSVGLPLQGIDVRLAGSGGQPCGPGQVGIVYIRGPNLFQGYWGKPEATRAAYADGWFDTGDLGYLDGAGFLTLVGRKNDLIITNGYNVYPQVVERVINACPGVLESAVVGLPDASRGERVAVAVVRADPNLDADDLRAYWSARLVEYQRPRELVFLDALPRNALGKVLRHEVRQRIVAKP